MPTINENTPQRNEHDAEDTNHQDPDVSSTHRKKKKSRNAAEPISPKKDKVDADEAWQYSSMHSLLREALDIILGIYETFRNFFKLLFLYFFGHYNAPDNNNKQTDTGSAHDLSGSEDARSGLTSPTMSEDTYTHSEITNARSGLISPTMSEDTGTCSNPTTSEQDSELREPNSPPDLSSDHNNRTGKPLTMMFSLGQQNLGSNEAHEEDEELMHIFRTSTHEQHRQNNWAR